ncbi:MAG TPA: hypothetical protein VFT56_05400 [Sphingomonas sp.]|nr:hypothetical protein [Sphingomonas sp.]
MNAPLTQLRPGAAQTVTASTLVRQFGLWQERAAHAPVYVMHRGRPRLALASIELMEALCASQSPGGDGAEIGALLDAIRELVVIVDADLAIARMSLAARRYFGLDRTAMPALDQLGSPTVADFLAERTRRAIERGLAETVEIVTTRRPGRRLSIDILPWGGGAALIAEDVTLDDERREAEGHVRALDDALAAVEDAAAARINLRGYLEDPAPSLAALTGIALETLASVRFVTLLEVGSRVAVADAIEAVIADGSPRGVTARMPVNRADVRPIRIGLSLLRRGVAPDGVAAVLVGDRLEKP